MEIKQYFIKIFHKNHDLKDESITVSNQSGFKNRQKVYPVNRNHVAKERQTETTFEGKEREKERKTQKDTIQYDDRSRKIPLIEQIEGIKRLEKEDINGKIEDPISKTHNLSDSKDGRKKSKRRNRKDKTRNDQMVTAHVKKQNNEEVLKGMEYQNGD
jgi:hypothetical protein